jgi:hypothetical protein
MVAYTATPPIVTAGFSVLEARGVKGASAIELYWRVVELERRLEQLINKKLTYSENYQKYNPRRSKQSRRRY